MVAASGIVTQVATNNVGGTPAPPPINGGTTPAHVGCLHRMGSSSLAYQYAVQKSLYVNITKMLFLILNSLCSLMTHRRTLI